MAALVAAASGAAAVAIASATAAKDQRSASRFGMFHRFPLVFYIAEHARAGIAGSLHTRMQAATGSDTIPRARGLRSSQDAPDDCMVHAGGSRLHV